MSEAEAERLRQRAADLTAQNARLTAAVSAADNAHERHRAIFESAVDFAIVATDRKGLITDWNTGAERIFGWSAEEIRGDPAERFFTPEDRAADRIAIEMQRALQAGRASDERWHLKKDGSRFWASGEMMPLRAADGAHLGFLKIIRDRTEQRRNAEAQRADTEFLERVLASSADCIKVLDLEAKLTFMSPGGMRVMEVSDFNAIRGCPWPDFWVGQGNVAARAALEAAMRGGKGHFQGFSETLAGTPKWWDVQVTPILGSDGKPEKLLVVSRDMSATRRAEEQLRVLNESLERQVAERTADRNRLWQLSTDVMLVARFDGVITAVNPAWTAVLGWSELDLIGNSLFELVHPLDHDRTVAVAKSLSAGVHVGRFDNRCRHKQGSYRWISWTAVPGEDLVNAVGRDVTADKEQAEALREAEERLRQGQKMEAVGQLTGGIAHDFNNLLQGIVGSVSVAQKLASVGRAAEIDRFLTTALGATKRAAALTHRLLAFSRRQPLDPRPVDVNQLVATTEDLLRRALGETIQLELILASDLWLTRCDHNQLENAILNLAINARDAMQDGGKLTIETGNAELNDLPAGRQQDVARGEYVCISVCDTGAGMSAEVAARAFEPFFTTKPLGQGTGLGLSMIYGFARQSEGDAKIRSELGKGTTVNLYLPRYRGTLDECPSDATQVEPAALGAGTILVIEDESIVRDLIVEVLNELGYRVLQAKDGPAGLTLLNSHENIGLLITDVGLPGLNGRQVADAARERRPKLKVIFMTGYAENAGLSSGFLDQGMQILTKPFAMDELAHRVRRILEEK